MAEQKKYLHIPPETLQAYTNAIAEEVNIRWFKVSDAVKIVSADSVDNEIPTAKAVYDIVLKFSLQTKQDLNSVAFKKVEVLPETGETKYIYLVPQEKGNIHDVYYWVSDDDDSGHFEKMGDTSIDLSGYVTVELLNQTISKVKEELEKKIDSIISNTVTVIDENSTDKQYATAKAIWELYQKSSGGGGGGGKPIGSFTLSTNEVSLNIGKMYEQVTVSRLGDGDIIATTKDTDIINVAVSGTTITITAVTATTGDYNCTVTVKVDEGTEYAAAPSQTINVSVSIKLPSTDLSQCTPGEIQWATENGFAPDLWDVGDKTAPIALNGNVGGEYGMTFNNDSSYSAYILGFNHNTELESDGNPNIHFAFGKTSNNIDIALCESNNYDRERKTSGFIMADKTYTHWENSYMRQTVCSDFYKALPVEWQNVISPCVKYDCNAEDLTEWREDQVTPTYNKIWILSLYELFGYTGGQQYINNFEREKQQRYDYYKNGNNPAKYESFNLTTKAIYWLRTKQRTGATSVTEANSDYFSYQENQNITSNSGLTTRKHGTYYEGFAPCFMVM